MQSVKPLFKVEAKGLVAFGNDVPEGKHVEQRGMQFRQGITDVALVVDHSGVVELLDNHTPGAFFIAVEYPKAVDVGVLPEYLSLLPSRADQFVPVKFSSHVS